MRLGSLGLRRLALLELLQGRPKRLVVVKSADAGQDPCRLDAYGPHRIFQQGREQHGIRAPVEAADGRHAHQRIAVLQRCGPRSG